MTIKDMLNDNSNFTSYQLQLPRCVVQFLRYKAYVETEKGDKRVSQVHLIKKAILSYYQDEIKKYLKEKGL